MHNYTARLPWPGRARSPARTRRARTADAVLHNAQDRSQFRLQLLPEPGGFDPGPAHLPLGARHPALRSAQRPHPRRIALLHRLLQPFLVHSAYYFRSHVHDETSSLSETYSKPAQRTWHQVCELWQVTDRQEVLNKPLRSRLVESAITGG